MKDPTVPSLAIPLEGVLINIIIPQTQSLLENQGYTYDQAGFTYNQAGIAYGGVYNTNQDVIPMDLSVEEGIEPIDDSPSFVILNDLMYLKMVIPPTQALLENQGYTYNQAGFTYDQAGILYGGVYNTNQDVVPIELSFIDIYSKGVIPPIGGSKNAPGWFLFINLN